MDLATVTLAELAPFVLGLLAAGLFAGLLAGFLGVGGGIIIVPVLFHVFSILGIDEAVRMHLAVGTSLGAIVPTSIRSVRAHAKKGAVDFELLRRWIAPVLVGVIIGTVLASRISSEALTGIFAVVAVLVAANMVFGKESWRLGDDLPSKPVQWGISGVIGALSAMMGIGGGTFGVTLLTLYGRTIHQAVATSAGLGLIISVPGVIGFMVAGWNEAALPPFSLGYVNLVGLALIVPATVLTAPWGARFAHSISRLALARAFAVFLIIMSARMFYGLLT